jgi:hypothetical protein
MRQFQWFAFPRGGHLQENPGVGKSLNSGTGLAVRARAEREAGEEVTERKNSHQDPRQAKPQPSRNRNFTTKVARGKKLKKIIIRALRAYWWESNEETPPMTDEKKKRIDQSAHRLPTADVYHAARHVEVGSARCLTRA